jgi:hypothetical protein
VTVLQGSRLEDILRACRIITRMSGIGGRKSEAMYYQMLTKYYNRLLHARENGDFIAYLRHGTGADAYRGHHLDDIPVHRQMR